MNSATATYRPRAGRLHDNTVGIPDGCKDTKERRRARPIHSRPTIVAQIPQDRDAKQAGTEGDYGDAGVPIAESELIVDGGSGGPHPAYESGETALLTGSWVMFFPGGAGR